MKRTYRMRLRWLLYFLLLFLCLIIGGFFYIFGDAIYHRYWVFPAEAEAWQDIRESRIEPESLYGLGLSVGERLKEYRGVLHSHSHLSHDSEVTYETILGAAKLADINFLFMTNHCHQGKADYGLGWSGLHDGILFVRGHEGSNGFLTWGLPDETVLDCWSAPELLAQEIQDLGGSLYFAHSEEPRLWSLPQYTGMEIYNIHTDFKDGESYGDLFPQVWFSAEQYPMQLLRTIFDRQTDILKHWDALNSERRVVGISATDAHQNNGIRLVYRAYNRLELSLTSPEDVIDSWQLNDFTQMLLGLVFGDLRVDKELFRYQLDRYDNSLKYVNTHIMAEELSEQSLLAALNRGRAYIAFDAIADARGFEFALVSKLTGELRGILGDEVDLDLVDEPVLRAVSPYPVRFTLLRDGELIYQSVGRSFEFELTKGGNYRLEAELNILGDYVPFIYTNHIRLRGVFNRR